MIASLLLLVGCDTEPAAEAPAAEAPAVEAPAEAPHAPENAEIADCLLYTSDAADDP